MAGYDAYKTPLDSRYSSDEMKQLFSQRSRHSTWRKLWLYLAEAEKELGIDTITDAAITQMKQHLIVSNDDFGVAAVEEKRRKHDVMAHVHAFGQVAPEAAGIIHYGATSCYVTDNAELILMKNALELIMPKLAKVIYNLRAFALEWKDEPTLGYTHYQPAQMITVGKRACQWIQMLMMGQSGKHRASIPRPEVQRCPRHHWYTSVSFDPCIVCKQHCKRIGGTSNAVCLVRSWKSSTTMPRKVDRLNEILCQKAGFPSCYDISYQTYPRKVDLNIANAVAGLGATCMQITGDIRHLANMKEVEEPFSKDQIGSSAMAYKRNPMLSERIASLGRKLASLPINFMNTMSVQWMERSLDDSAIRRSDIPELFLLADACMIGMDALSNGLVVYPKRIHAHNLSELPFMITENIIMKICAQGGNRQDAHEEIRVLSHQASAVVKNEGGENDLVERIKNTEYFKPVWGDIDGMMDPKLYVGRAPEIVQRYAGQAGPVEVKLAPYMQKILHSATAQLNV
ncbi:hypothetical protein PG997_013245 [Apiospora hydei]|uniref:Adenylosuccinate lyase C-terminal domain-containing protein n=1 Tax=Apiospora hydei TaxID=1337664 RepID=A0ABR1V957_9PEZI